MNGFLWSSLCGFALVALNWLTFGILYTFASRIMPYHLQAMGSDWEGLAPGIRVMSLNFMKSAAAGFLSSATAVGFLLLFPFRRREPWSVWALAAVTFLELFIVLFRTINVKRNTGAKVPLRPQIVFSVIAVISFGLGIIGMNV
jgi:hypothetical protein